MKQLVLSAWTWVVAHPAESLGALSTLLYLAINVINSRVPVEKREHNGWYKVLDALAIATQKGSESKASWPVVGRSIAKAVASAVIAEQPQADAAQPQRPSVMPPSEPGYVEQWMLGAIALVAVVALALSGCAAAQSPSLSPISPHLVERPEYGTCAETGGKLEVPQAGTVALLTSVCWMRADAGVAVDAAPEPVIVVPEKGDAGAVE